MDGRGTHLHISEQRFLARKHSQYFFRQREFLQLQPLMCSPRARALCSRPHHAVKQSTRAAYT